MYNSGYDNYEDFGDEYDFEVYDDYDKLSDYYIFQRCDKNDIVELKQAICDLNEILYECMEDIFNSSLYENYSKVNTIQELTYNIKRTAHLLEEEIPYIKKLIKSKGGRPKKTTIKDVRNIMKLHRQGLSLNKINEQIPHLGRSTIHRIIVKRTKR